MAEGNYRPTMPPFRFAFQLVCHVGWAEFFSLVSDSEINRK